MAAGIERSFWFDLGESSGERVAIEAKLHRGGVIFTEHTTNPNYGGASDLGALTFDELLEKGPPEALDAEARREILDAVRARAATDADDPNAWDARGRSRLTRAALAGEMLAVRKLLVAGADVRAPDLDGWTPLHAAARNHHVEIVERLLAAGADPNARSENGSVPLSSALGVSPSDAHDRTIETLIAGGARADATLLVSAASYGLRRAARAMLRAGAAIEPDAQGQHPLVAAAAHVGMVLDLLAAGADPRVVDGWGQDAIGRAIEHRAGDSISVLISAGALVPERVPGWIAKARALPAHEALATMIEGLARDPVEHATLAIELALGRIERSEVPDEDDLLRVKVAIPLARSQLGALGEAEIEVLASARYGPDTAERSRKLLAVRHASRMTAALPQDPASIALREIEIALSAMRDAYASPGTEHADRTLGSGPDALRRAFALAPDELTRLLPELAPALRDGTIEPARLDAALASVVLAKTELARRR